MRRSIQHEPEEQRRVPSDPEGFQTRTRKPNRDETEVLSEQKLRRVMDRAPAKERRSDSTYQSIDELTRQNRTTEHRDTIWNSFTGSYHHGGDPNLRRAETTSSRPDAAHSNEQRIAHQQAQHYRYNEPEQGITSHRHEREDTFPHRRTRRVKFAEKLEVDTKAIPETPKTPTMSILRKTQRSTPRKDETKAPRDPTPQARVKSSSEKDRIRDPPVDQPKNQTVSSQLESGVHRNKKSSDTIRNPFFSPPNNPTTSRSHSRHLTSDGPQSRRRMMDHSTPDSSSVISPKSDLWSVVDMIRRSSRQGATNHAQSRDPSETTRPATQTVVHSSEIYSPESSHLSDTNSPCSLSEGSNNIPLSWRMDSPSLSEEQSTESQTTYLINKYGGRYRGRSKVMMAARSLVRAAGSVASPTSGGGRVSGSKAADATVPGSGRVGGGTKGSIKQAGYTHLDEESDVQEGTEIQLPFQTSQPQIADNDASNSIAAIRETKAKGRENLRVLGRSSHLGSLGLQSQDLPVFARGLNVSNGGMPSTSETDDSDSEIFYNWKGSDWDTFDVQAEDGEQEHDQLIPSKKTNSREKRRRALLLLLVLMAIVALGVAIYFKLVRKPSAIDTFPIDKSPCVTNNIISSERFVTIRRHLVDALTINEASMLDLTNTPQRKALCWISDVDERQIPARETETAALVQRYTMGVLFFSLVKENTQDPVSLQNTDFLSSQHECDWEVIMCSREENVTALLLADKLLSGSIPAEIGNLRYLSFLELSLNKLSSSIPSSVGRLSTLEYLGIAFNTLTGSLPTEIGAMTKLEFINMRSSQVTGPIPSELGRLTNLETLLLEGNWLSGSIPGELANLQKAEQMSFRRNYLSGSVIPEICDLRSGALKELEVDSWVACDCCTS